MNTRLISLAVVFAQFLFIVGCSTLKTGVKPARTKDAKTEMVSEETARLLADAIAAWDRERLDKFLQENDPSDPVILCAEGNFELHEGNYENAVRLFLDALSFVSDRRITYTIRAVQFQPMPSVKKRLGAEPPLAEDREILNSARQFFYGEIGNAELVRMLATRSTLIPHPPTYRSTMGLVLEIINEYSRSDLLFPRYVEYPVVGGDTAKAELALRKVININTITSALLAGDAEALRSGMEELKKLPRMDGESAFFISVAGFFLRSDDLPKFVSRNVRLLLTN